MSQGGDCIRVLSGALEMSRQTKESPDPRG